MATLTDDPGFTCVWCGGATVVDLAAFPACSTTCKEAASRYRKRTLRRWRPTP